MSAWIALSRKSRPYRPTGKMTMVRAVMTREGDLAAVDVAEESEGERDRLDELEHELDETDEQRDDAGADAVLELVEREELAGIALEAELAEALRLEDHERQQGEAQGDVEVARRCPEPLDAADARDQADPVGEQDEQEERGEQRHVRAAGGPGDAESEIAERLVERLEHVLEPVRLLAQAAGHDDGADQDERSSRSTA